MRLSEAFEIDREMKERGCRYVIVGRKTGQSERRVPLPAGVLTHLPKAIKGRLFAGTDRIHPFGLGRSPRISLNSCGPLRSRRFRLCRSSSVADESASLSICWPASSDAFDAALGLRRFIGRDPASPNSTRRRMASERDCAPAFFDHPSISVINPRGSRIPTNGSRPVAGLPSFFGFTVIDFAIKFSIVGLVRNEEQRHPPNIWRPGAESESSCSRRKRSGTLATLAAIRRAIHAATSPAALADEMRDFFQIGASHPKTVLPSSAKILLPQTVPMRRPSWQQSKTSRLSVNRAMQSPRSGS
jgi:hypothetical protein